jgi:hypothetical protein
VHVVMFANILKKVQRNLQCLPNLDPHLLLLCRL